MNKEKFLREDWKTYKPKFILCCKDCDSKIIVQKFCQVEKKPYISRVEIKERQL